MERYAYVSQISGENGPRSNFIKIFRSDRSNAQTFYLSFNNLALLTGLAVLMGNAPTFICSRILRLAVLEFVRFHAFRVDPRRNQTCDLKLRLFSPSFICHHVKINQAPHCRRAPVLKKLLWYVIRF